MSKTATATLTARDRFLGAADALALSDPDAAHPAAGTRPAGRNQRSLPV
jgi:hypothetical protein